MPGLCSEIDPAGLLEYSVVFTDRSLNHMSLAFQNIMRDIHSLLCQVYNADRAVVIPGGGTYAMEAVARQFATQKKVLVLRNGLFSYRWSQIFEMASIPSEELVLKADFPHDQDNALFSPPNLERVLATIKAEKPNVVFAPHVETSSGILLSDPYLRAIANEVHAAGGIFVLDCIASGCLWVDMKDLGIDVLISAPQKGWSSPPSSGLVMMNARALELCNAVTSTSFAIDLGKWTKIMEAYLAGGHAYHATMPTDALRSFHSSMLETKAIGFENLREAQWRQGDAVREMLKRRGIQSVAAPEWAAPGVVVAYTDDANIHNGRKFAELGIQIAAGVPLMVGESESFRTFRLGLFGLDKLKDVDASLAKLEHAFDAVWGNAL